jgi:hypothetical protein
MKEDYTHLVNDESSSSRNSTPVPRGPFSHVFSLTKINEFSSLSAFFEDLRSNTRSGVEMCPGEHISRVMSIDYWERETATVGAHRLLPGGLGR